MKEQTRKAVHLAGWLILTLVLGCDSPSSANGHDDDASAADASSDGNHQESSEDETAGADGGDGSNEVDDGPGDGDSDPQDDPAADAGSAQDAGEPSAYAHVVEEPFDGFDTAVWGCEYTCPSVADGHAEFLLQAGIPPDNEGSWSKIGYKPTRFTAGRFTVRFALSERPRQKVWWGTALWDDGENPDGSEFNEINFGYTTNQSFSNTQLLFESARRGNFDSVKVDLGTDLYDGSYHVATLEYDATHVAFYFDGKLMHTITDPDVIPTDPMKFIIGPRLVTGSTPLDADFTETVDWARIEW